MTLQVFLSKGFTATSGLHLAIGVRGDVTTRASAGNGADKNTQQGWSLRVNYNDYLKPLMYGYHLNRNDKFGSGPSFLQHILYRNYTLSAGQGSSC